MAAENPSNQQQIPAKEAPKNKLPTSKNYPKDAQVVQAIMKEMGVTEYEPKTVVQLTEFVYRYGSTVLEEARSFANNCKKKIDLDDVKLALELQSEHTFSMPPTKDVLLEVASVKNASPLPPIKPPCGLRLPPDRHCLAAQNYVLKNTVNLKKKFIGNKPTVNIIKRQNYGNVKTKTVLKPKIQISEVKTESEKRKREDDDLE